MRSPRRVAELTRAGKLLSVAGGGDTVAALAAAGVIDELSYVSTAGGAFLEWLEGRELPGVAALSDAAARSRQMKASEVMTRNVVTVGRETSVAQAIRLMLDNNISGLPVLDDDGKVVGIVTEGDLLRRSETGTERHRPRWLEILMGPGRMAGEYVRTHGRKVEEIMTADLISVAGDTPLEEVVGLMERRRIKRVPVLDGDVLVGMVSRLDLLRALLGAIEAQHSEDRGDDDIREQILAELAKAAWVPRDGLSISVKDGVVDLNGVILEEKEREALRVVAGECSGSKSRRGPSRLDRTGFRDRHRSPTGSANADTPISERKHLCAVLHWDWLLLWLLLLACRTRGRRHRCGIAIRPPMSHKVWCWLSIIAARVSTGSPPVTQNTANTEPPTAPPD